MPFVMKGKVIARLNLTFAYRYILIGILLIFWQLASSFELVPRFLLPSPAEIIIAFKTDFWLILSHAKFTFYEAFVGLFLGVVAAFIFSIFMDRFRTIFELFYPLVLLSQTIPTIAIAPLLVLWLGYGVLPKIVLVFITSFFPILMSLLEGYKNVDRDFLNLFKTFKAKPWQEYYYLKVPFAIPNLLAGIKISTTYALITALVAEWLGGFMGLGVYMTRVVKSFALDKMFAVIIFISVCSITLMYIVAILEKKFIYKGD